jgi:Tol biopolymer transport system component
MMRLPLLFLALAAILAAQPDLRIDLVKPGQTVTLAVPDFRGDTQSQLLMATFNETLWRDLDDAAFFQMVPKSLYPAVIPQQASELRPQEWSAPPAQAIYLAMGYAAAQNGTFMLRAWLMDVRNPTAATAQVFEKRYGASPDASGARQAAHQFSSDILAKFGVPSLLGTHIYFVRESRRPPDRRTEIWMMDFDGSNQHRVAGGNGIFNFPSASPDGSRLAFAQMLPRPELLLYSIDPARALPFQNASNLSAVSAPSFTPDGKQIVFAQSIRGRGLQIYFASAGSPTTSAVIDPGGTLLSYQPYGQEGLLIADIDLAQATGLLASRLRTT